MDIQHNNALENRQTDLLPSGQPRCKRNRKGRSKCQELALPGDIYCHKHRFEQDIYCEKLKTARKKKENHSLTDPLLPSGQRQCTSNGKRWRCASPSNDVASEREQKDYNEKECRKRKDRGLIESDEMNSSSGDCSTVLKRARENVEERSFEEVRVESLKRDSGKDVVSEESLLFPFNEGVVGEHAEKNPSIAQIHSMQLLCVSLEDHQVRSLVDANANPSTMEDNDATPDIQVIPVDPITMGESTVESVEQPQSLNEVEDPLDFEFTVEGVLPTLDITCSSIIQQEESPLPLENVSSFVKTSHLWKQVYSFETFKKSPQYPHFRPLENVNEEIREGRALGLMFNFDQLMESTLRAQIDIPETVLINRLNALTDLEQYGFTVHPLRSRLEKLLKIKKDYILLNESFKAAEEEFTNEKHHLDEMKESISQLNMKLQQFSAEKEIKDRKVLELRKIETEAKEKIQRIQVEFDRVVAAFGRNLGY